MKKIFLVSLTTISLSIVSFAQKELKPSSIGIMKEFSGKIISSTQYDYDEYFSINDPKNGKVFLYFKNGSCNVGEDKYELDVKVSNELYNIIISEDGWKDVKVKVVAKSTYGFECGNCDNCKKKRVIIWRPIQITKI